MIAELGQLALVLALGLALLLGVLPLLGAKGGPPATLTAVCALARGQSALVAIAFALLVAAFVADDFSVAYVVAHSNSHLPLCYRVAAAWGGHEGALLLWLLILAAWIVAVSILRRGLPDATAARILAVLGLISSGFISFCLFTSNPFARQLPAAPDGLDLNPLLQDAAMIIHPPLLYAGYVGFSVAFAFAVVALIEGRLDARWAKWTRPWTLLAWSFLTLGILLGSFWAYYELGWGGWWFWDAVENASLMPWLVGTALLHSLAVAEKRGSFKSWTVLLAILAFSLSLLGTFLVRSGVLSSVHAFATDPRRGLYILALLAAVVGTSLALYAWRVPAIGLGKAYRLFSRDAALLINNIFLLVTTGTILLGTLYPLVLDTLGRGKISVGPPYFNAVVVPLSLPLGVLLGAGPFFAWRQASAAHLWRMLRAPLGISTLLAFGFWLSLRTRPAVSAGVLLAVWMAAATLRWLLHRLHETSRGGGYTQAWRKLPLASWGMVSAHLGMAVFVFGVSLVSGLDHVRDASLHPGEHLQVGPYDFAFTALSKVRGPNYIGTQARFVVNCDGRVVATLYPEKRFYLAAQMPTTEAAIDRGWSRDLYLSLGEAVPDGAWSLRVQIKPFMAWVWSGFLLIALGGVLAAADRRYRRVPATATVPDLSTPPHSSAETAPSFP